MINRKFKRALFACVMAVGLAGIFTSSAQAVVVQAFTNSSSGGAGVSTGVLLTTGDIFTVDVDPNELASRQPRGIRGHGGILRRRAAPVVNPSARFPASRNGSFCSRRQPGRAAVWRDGNRV